MNGDRSSELPFTTYPVAVGSKLDNLPSSAKHCGICHYDFNGGGPRTPYGLGIEIGRANVVQQGGDLTIVACGLMVGMALDAAAELAEQGIMARVLDMPTLRPMDKTALIDAARETGAIVTAEEHLLQGGMGSNIARVVSEACPVPMRFIGLADVYVESADPYELLEKYHLTAKDIVTAAAEVYAA